MLLKSADGLERLAAVDTVALDKTGTLTMGRLGLVGADAVAAADLATAAALATRSRHPASRALVEAAGDAALPEAHGVGEVPGQGLEGIVAGRRARLGRRAWCGVAGEPADESPGTEIWLAVEGRPPVRFRLADSLRPDAAHAVAALRALGLVPTFIIPCAIRRRPEAPGRRRAPLVMPRHHGAPRS